MIRHIPLNCSSLVCVFIDRPCNNNHELSAQRVLRHGQDGPDSGTYFVNVSLARAFDLSKVQFYYGV